jgi:hypothetical protein
MTSTKLIVALALLLSATSATLAKSRAYYDYAPGAQSGDTYNAPSGYDPTEASQR